MSLKLEEWIEQQADRIEFGEIQVVAKIRDGMIVRVEKSVTVAENLQPSKAEVKNGRQRRK